MLTILIILFQLNHFIFNEFHVYIKKKSINCRLLFAIIGVQVAKANRRKKFQVREQVSCSISLNLVSLKKAIVSTWEKVPHKFAKIYYVDPYNQGPLIIKFQTFFHPTLSLFGYTLLSIFRKMEWGVKILISFWQFLFTV